MPSKSPAQHRFMEAIEHDPKFASKAGVPQRVGKEFVTADKQRGLSQAIRGVKAVKGVK